MKAERKRVIVAAPGARGVSLPTQSPNIPTPVVSMEERLQPGVVCRVSQEGLGPQQDRKIQKMGGGVGQGGMSRKRVCFPRNLTEASH